MKKRIFWIGVVVLGCFILPMLVCGQDLTIRKRPFSLTNEYEITDNYGRNKGTMRERPFTLTPEYEIRDEYGRNRGTLRKKPFSLTDEWEYKEN